MYAFGLKDNDSNIDKRNLPTRGHDGIKLVVRKASNPRYYRSIYYRAVDAWNKLDAIHTTIVDKVLFKKFLKNLYGNIFTENMKTCRSGLEVDVDGEER